MSHNLTKVNSQPGLSVNVTTTTVNEGTNLYFTEARTLSVVETERETNPVIQDKHFYTTGEVAVKQGDLYWRIISPIKILECKAYVGTAPTGATLSLHVVKNDSSAPEDLLYNLDINVSSNETSSQTSHTLAVGDYLRVDIVQIGSTVKGSDLIVSFKYQSILN